jgi:hypothetical protein
MMAATDGELLAQLARSGSDLAVLHHIDFTLRFPSRFTAEQAELKLVGLAFLDTRIEAGKTDKEWVVRGWKRMYPVESDLQQLRDKLELIAAEGRGTYDGWKAKAISKP